MAKNRTKHDINIRTSIIDGGAAGDLTVTGISTSDILVGVHGVAFAINAGTPADDSPIDLGGASVGDLTSEFSISAADTINNTGGTATSANILFLTWLDVDA